ncbi:hypothetical protein ITJ57_09895 [Plantibacter sp. VKM Ac-2880]|uniref:DUF6301 family protein n=1 Tax=Plantibacter sp. VKM Ac-2880 TaxID=2783827 RepID=UPI001890428C|nr:DUF6301 family protein [Plantibacter sp. VKM Ac-2880]MBF4569075.1 hypothetical protein [Plantibacter sp. VKM Ac-2880]
MTTLAKVTDVQLDAVCEAFASVSWPLGRDDFATLAWRLGWQPKAQTSSGVQHRSGYPVNLPTIRSLIADQAISQVTIAVSDKSDDTTGLRSAALEVQSALSRRLGQPSGAHAGDHFWELDNGGRIWLKTVPKKVLLVIEERRFADVERREERPDLGSD